MGEKRVKLSRMRKLIGDNLRKSVVEIPQASGYTRLDFTEVLRMQQELRERGIKVPTTVFFIKAITMGLEEYPELNARLEGDEAVYYDSINPGVGVNTKNGLMVLVMKDAQGKSLLKLAEEFLTLLEKLNKNQLTMDDISGGTITISNLSKSRTLYFSSIVNNNESLIMGVGGIHKEASVLPDGSIAARDICNLAININHTLVDGMASALFLERVSEILEKPYDFFTLD